MRGVLLAACVLLHVARGSPSPQGRVPRLAEVMFRGLVAADRRGQFWLLDVYKGAERLGALLGLQPDQGGVLDFKDRLVNVSESRAAPQGQYIVFCELDGDLLVVQDAEEWTPGREDAVWAAVGWEPWSDWSACSASCGEGVQERRRFCRQQSCPGYNKESRRCNTFSCQGAVSPLELGDKRFFHPSRSHWEHVPGRNTAWRLRPNSYIWVPSTELFPPPGHFPKEFSLLVTLRLHSQVQGTVFSLRSRRQQDAYLSLELDSSSNVKLVHAGRNGTQTLDISAPLGDRKWHQLAIGLHGDSSVTSYFDCSWVSTEILRRNALDTPEDADIVIGYLFMGDLEQLTVVSDPAAVEQQCSATRTPLLDPLLLPQPATSDPPLLSKRTKARKGVDYGHEPDKFLSNAVEDSAPGGQQGKSSRGQRPYEGGGTGSDSSEDMYERAWSPWSECSATCGPGSQSRYSLCADDSPGSGADRTETRSCSRAPCAGHHEALRRKLSAQSDLFDALMGNDTALNGTFKRVLEKMHLHSAGGAWKRCGCLHGGSCRAEDRSCLCPAGYSGRRCEHVSCRPECLHGGWCAHPDTCSCPQQYTGQHCETPVCEPPCRHGGECVGPHTCHCPRGTSGLYCQTFSCKYPCVNGGACVGPDQCECPRNATGPTCATPVCDPPCENGATCGPGNTCLCMHGTSGMRCEKRKCEYQPYQEPFTRGFRRLVSRKSETKCSPWGQNTCEQSQPEYQTIYKTFYRTVYKCVTVDAG